MDALLGAVWLYATDVSRAVEFYRDAVGLPLIEENEHVAHFDAGNVRLSIHPAREPPGSGGFYVFVVDDIYATAGELASRGVEFEGAVTEEVYGRVIEFRDPDGHELFLWQLRDEQDPVYEQQRALVEHYAKLRSALGR
jgi:predicted enzyme related to lactoylglutathione lyase